MFKCGICTKNSKVWEKAVRVVLESRAITYPRIEKAHTYINREGIKVVKDDPGGQGTAIVKEVLAHSICALQIKQLSNASGLVV